jgi:large subunit ribosomal protein L29
LELSELRQMAVPDLRIKEREAREEIFKLRLKLRTNQLESRANYMNARRELARILTLIREHADGANAARAKTGSSARKG